MALIIGNSDYDGKAWAYLPNTKNDARLIYDTFKAAGFDVGPPLMNLKYQQLQASLEKFKQRIATLPTDTIVWIYYSGHGVQLNGVNYLIPVGAPGVEDVVHEVTDETEHQLVKAFFPVNSLIEVLGTRTHALVNTANVIVLDACRSNPFLRGPNRDRGLAEMPQIANLLMSFSASAGMTASDGPVNGNSPYATAFANSISNAYLPLELVFNSINKDVASLTAGIQRPEYRVGLAGYFCIKQCTFYQPPGVITGDTAQPGRARGLNSHCEFCIPVVGVHLGSGKTVLVDFSILCRIFQQECRVGACGAVFRCLGLQAQQGVHGIEGKRFEQQRIGTEQSGNGCCRCISDLKPDHLRRRTAYQCQTPEVIVLAHDNKIIVPSVCPDGLVAGTAHAELFDMRATRPVKGEFSHKPGTQVLIEEQFHAAV